MEKLTSLKHLILIDNQISEIQGLESLKELELLQIGVNPIDPQLFEKLGGLDEKSYANQPQKFVAYCRKNK